MTIIAIDGPAGSGKTTVAAAVAARLGLPHVDTGAYYRALTLAALEAGVDTGDEAALVGLADRIDLHRRDGHTVMDGQDVSARIRTPQVDDAVSTVAAHADVRTRLIDRQRRDVTASGGVVEGRDAGTRVVPGADLKVWLTANPEARARRRALDMAGGRTDAVDVAFIAQQASAIEARDRRDRPNMEQAADVRTIDSTGLTVEEVVDRVLALLDSARDPGPDRGAP